MTIEVKSVRTDPRPSSAVWTFVNDLILGVELTAIHRPDGWADAETHEPLAEVLQLQLTQACQRWIDSGTIEVLEDK